MLLAAAFDCSAGSGFAMDIDQLREYGDPAVSEARFRAALSEGRVDAGERLELLTQIARTHSLRRGFGTAHRLLDEVEPGLATAGAAPRVRALLERGRCFNSAGDAARARRLFEQAFARAQAAQLDGLAVDAARLASLRARCRPRRGCQARLRSSG